MVFTARLHAPGIVSQAPPVGVRSQSPLISLYRHVNIRQLASVPVEHGFCCHPLGSSGRERVVFRPSAASAVLQEPQTESPAVSETGPRTFKLKYLLSDEAAAAMIGTESSEKRAIEAASGASLHFSERPTYRSKDGNAVPRAMFVSGTQDQVVAALGYMLSKADTYNMPRVSADPDKVKTRLALPRKNCGQVIGKGGSIIQGVAKETGAWLKMSDDDAKEGFRATERILSFAGTGAETSAALAKILDVLTDSDFGIIDDRFTLNVVIPADLYESPHFSSQARGLLEKKHEASFVMTTLEKALIPRTKYCRVRVKTPSEYQARCLEAELLALGAEVAKEKLPNYNGSPERSA